jgi:hypothetical protein
VGVSFAGVGIGGKPDLTSEMQELLDRWWHVHGIEEWEYPGYFSRDLGHLGIPAPPRQKAPELNTLTCPSGCSRFGTYHALITGEQLTAINAALLSSGSGNHALLLTDGAGGGFYTQMWMMPPRPVCQKGTVELYLLTLVDWRWLNLYRLPGFVPWAPGGTWADAISALMSAVAPVWFVTPFPTIDAAYGNPSNRWPNSIGTDSTAAPLAPMADAAFEAIGCRYCYVPFGAGTFEGLPTNPADILRQPDAAKTLADLQWETWKNKVLCGGRLSVTDAIRSVPRSIFWFAYDRWDYGVDGDSWPSGDAFKSVNVNGGSFDIDLALTDYADTTVGLPISYGSLQMVADLSGAAGSVALAAYATQASTDFYKWALSRTDATFRGIIPWATTGFEDCIAWRVRDDGYTTTVYRRPFGDLNRYGTDIRIAAARVLPTKASVVGTKTLKTVPGGPAGWVP